MGRRLDKTAIGMGDDGKQYTIHSYIHKVDKAPGVWEEEALSDDIETDEGERVTCNSEEPLVFTIDSTGVVVRCEALK